MNANDPVARQVDAYNRRDIDAFLDCYAQDTVVEDATGNVVMRGQKAMRTALYAQAYARRPGGSNPAFPVAPVGHIAERQTEQLPMHGQCGTAKGDRASRQQAEG